ncbi:hypothetical protein E2562_010871 [Oryza meyeriana var. granulata]|uniref:Uncharacterized protein n=1 Tax=Oryza meyeriana var. granulata TaxID=110450 RepID=A0A6G1BL83_9ORYZ|nr:hypothetical protein E2562_010871 [Oryza meyeriana var. granulata]
MLPKENIVAFTRRLLLQAIYRSKRTASYAEDHDAEGATSHGAVYLVFRPHVPSFSVTSLSIRGLDTLALSPSSPQVDAMVCMDNDANKKTDIDYSGGREVTVSYSGKQLATGPRSTRR